MIIADLSYLESVSEVIPDLRGGASVSVGSFASAAGKYAFATTGTRTFATALPLGGSLAAGVTVGVAIAYTPSSH